MFEKGHYHYSLFFWQLVLEKLLKAIIISRTENYPIPVHDLVKLAKNAQLPLTDKQTKELQEITTFNLEARYDDYKHAFYQKATKKYALKWIQICQELEKLLSKLI